MCFNILPFHIIVIFKRESNGREKHVIYKIPCRDSKLCYIRETVQVMTREKQQKRYIQNQEDNNKEFRHIATGHGIAWENTMQDNERIFCF